jgi:hypothetical protein
MFLRGTRATTDSEMFACSPSKGSPLLPESLMNTGVLFRFRKLRHISLSMKIDEKILLCAKNRKEAW